jgi:hypothetical protein
MGSGLPSPIGFKADDSLLCWDAACAGFSRGAFGAGVPNIAVRNALTANIAAGVCGAFVSSYSEQYGESPTSC